MESKMTVFSKPKCKVEELNSELRLLVDTAIHYIAADWKRIISISDVCLKATIEPFEIAEAEALVQEMVDFGILRIIFIDVRLNIIGIDLKYIVAVWNGNEYEPIPNKKFSEESKNEA